MAPKKSSTAPKRPTKKDKNVSSSSASPNAPPTANQIKAWLHHNDKAIENFKLLQKIKFFNGIFYDLTKFPTYRLYEITEFQTNTSLIDFRDNNVQICDLSVMLFLANINNPAIRLHNEVGTLWSSVYGTIITITAEEIGRILKTSNVGQNFCSFEMSKEPDAITYDLWEEQNSNRSIELRPRPRLLLRMLIKTLFPRQGSHEVVYDEEEKALYAMFGRIKINWAQYIYDELRCYFQIKKQALVYGPFITRILNALNIEHYVTDRSSIKIAEERFFSLMHLPKELPRYLSYQQHQRHMSAQERGKNIIQEEGEEEEGEGEQVGYAQEVDEEERESEESEVEILKANYRSYTKKEKCHADMLITRNQKKLEKQLSQGFSRLNTRLDRIETDVGRSANEIRSLKTTVNQMWSYVSEENPPTSPQWGEW